MGILRKQITALKLGIEVLERERRRLYAAGEYAWQEGIRATVIDSDGITGQAFSFADQGHRGYVRYSEAIAEYEDMIEALSEAEKKGSPQMGLFEEVDDGPAGGGGCAGAPG